MWYLFDNGGEIIVYAIVFLIIGDAERKKLQQYASQIDELNYMKNRLAEINEQLKRKSFAKGKRDTDGISALKNEKTMTENRIDILDKKHLRLETSKPLLNIVERAKKKAIPQREQNSM